MTCSAANVRHTITYQYVSSNRRKLQLLEECHRSGDSSTAKDDNVLIQREIPLLTLLTKSVSENKISL